MLVSKTQPASPPKYEFSAAIQAVKNRSLQLLRPPPPFKVSEWAANYRVLSRKDSARPGRWRSEPHQDEIMDACRDPRVRKVVVMAASQVVGKSQMMDNIIGRFIDVDPSNMPVMHPTIAAAEKWSIGRLDPPIQETPRLHEKTQPRKSRSIGDRILHRQFRGGQMFIVGSSAPADPAARSVRIVMATRSTVTKEQRPRSWWESGERPRRSSGRRARVGSRGSTRTEER